METLKANELRIGNWVYIRQTKNNEQIGGIEENGRFLTKGYKSSYSSIECLEPIPLTEEWLVKLGFIKGVHGHYHNGGKFTIYNRGKHFGLIGGSLSWKEFHYVHQLQNLYFALTGNELTIKNQQL